MPQTRAMTKGLRASVAILPGLNVSEWLMACS
jgi:hypothetical protein